MLIDQGYACPKEDVYVTTKLPRLIFEGIRQRFAPGPGRCENVIITHVAERNQGYVKIQGGAEHVNQCYEDLQQSSTGVKVIWDWEKDSPTMHHLVKTKQLKPVVD